MIQTSSNHHGLTFSQERLAEFCGRYRICRLALFGSILRGDVGPNSDVDVLVEFEPGTRTGLKFFAIQDELSEIFGRRVDLNTRECLSKYFRDRVLAEAEVQYAES